MASLLCHLRLSRLLPMSFGLGLSAVLLGVAPASAQQQGYGQTLDGASGGGSGSAASGMGMGKNNSVLDAVNPIDLMNRIRRNQALDDATPPGDAIDQALKDYQRQPSASGSGASATVKGP
jgi:hypothetical protein